ncbi:MAG: hypothetical protein PUB37_03400, partial [Firmicutes bacterium]|nr:hypothetical protein [Bacillota bacterium]
IFDFLVSFPRASHCFLLLVFLALWFCGGFAPTPPQWALPLDPAKRTLTAIQGMAVSPWIPGVAYSMLNYDLQAYTPAL